MPTRRVVITAASAITPIGHGRDDIIRSLTQGISGVKKIKPDDLLTDKVEAGVFGTVDYDIPFDFERRYRKTMGPVAFYACQVAKEVLAASQLDQSFTTSGRLGVAFGSIHGSPGVQRNIYKNFYTRDGAGYSSIGAVDYLKSMVHTTAVNITRMFGITGRVISSGTACTTSTQSIGFGYEAVKFGLADAMLCGGADEYDTTTVAVFDNLLACSTEFNDQPHLTPRPFDTDRDGLVVGEGAAAVMLETLDSARKRGAPILGEIIGFACNNNGGDMILPNKNGMTAVIRQALDTAEIPPEAVDYISAHATATKMGDIIESQAIAKIFGPRPMVTGLKSYMGHTMAACGAIETVMTLYMMAEGFVAPTLNLKQVDERCADIGHVTALKEKSIRIAQIQNFAFGGVNTALIIRRPE